MQNELSLISQAQSGDIQSFQQLVEFYSHKLYTAAYRILGNKELAEDCVQEVFIKVYHKIGSFNQQSKFSTWLYSVTVNSAIDLQRKHKKHNTNESEDFEQVVCDSTTSPEASIWMDNISDATQRALTLLTEEMRVAFILRHHEERSIEEISQILDVNPNTVRNRIFRAVARLRELLSPKVGEYE